MTGTVHALLPLTLLEAVRSVDTPESADTEYVEELRNKRLGLSDTVYAQIRRYTEATRKNEKVSFADTRGIATLIGRRSDAGDVFRRAGTLLAERVYERINGVNRKFVRHMPALVSRPLAVHHMKRAVSRYMGSSLRRSGHTLVLRSDRPVAAKIGAPGAGCMFYESTLSALSGLLSMSSGAIGHPHCVERGDPECEWKAPLGAARTEAKSNA